MRSLFAFLKPAPASPPLPPDQAERLYPRLRYRMFEAAFLGYAVFYLVRNNLAPVGREMAASVGYTNADWGDFLSAASISYGIGKFLMGALSDRSNPRTFMPFGLLLTALCNFAFGAASDYKTHLILWTLNGLVQGMGWPPCGRTLGHWFSQNERGKVFAFWNIAHNVGGGVVGVVAAYALHHYGWRYAFYIPGLIALGGALYLLLRLKDTPQSVGLAPIEVHRNDFPPAGEHHDERELSWRELLIDNVLLNKFLWIFAIANFFVYIARYALIDWGPTYLKEARGATVIEGGMSTLYLEFAGIPSTILVGWVSDRLEGRRGLVSFLCMIPVTIGFALLYLAPPGLLWLDNLCFAMIGLFVYPPVALLGVAGLDMTSKKAVGAAAGFIGLMGYMGRTAQNQMIGAITSHKFDAAVVAIFGNVWEAAIVFMAASAAIGVLLLAITIPLRPRG